MIVDYSFGSVIFYLFIQLHHKAGSLQQHKAITMRPYNLTHPVNFTKLNTQRKPTLFPKALIYTLLAQVKSHREDLDENQLYCIAITKFTQSHGFLFTCILAQISPPPLLYLTAIKTKGPRFEHRSVYYTYPARRDISRTTLDCVAKLLQHNASILQIL